MTFPDLMSPPIGDWMGPRLKELLRRIASAPNGSRVFRSPSPRIQMDLDTLHAGNLIDLTHWGRGLEATIRDRGYHAIGARRVA